MSFFFLFFFFPFQQSPYGAGAAAAATDAGPVVDLPKGDPPGLNKKADGSPADNASVSTFLSFFFPSPFFSPLFLKL